MSAVRSSPFAALVACSFGSGVLAQELLRTYDGSLEKPELGREVHGGADLDGDGRDELVVVGFAAYVYSGADDTLLWQADGTGREYPADVADLDGDGLPDVILGVVDDFGGAPASVEVRSGVDGALLRRWESQNMSDDFGEAVDDAGDVDGDGWSDVLIGAPQTGFFDGAVYVYSGSTSDLLWERQGDGSELGSSVAGLGDMNGDGFSEVLVGARASRGKAFAYSGPTGQTVWRWEGGTGDQLGWAVDDAGDVDGDGVTDVLLGANAGGPSGQGEVLLYSGLSEQLIWSWHGENVFDLFGGEVASAGDVNGDDTPDVVIGARSHDGAAGSDSGRAYVYSGATGGLLAAWEGLPFDELGSAVAAGGRSGAAGVASVMIGAPDYDGPTRDSGRVYVYSGFSGLLVAPPEPGVAGEANRIDVEGASPFAAVTIVGSRRSGFTPVPGCVPMQASMEDAGVLGTATADAAGAASLVVDVPAALSGRLVLLQAVELDTCRASDLEAVRFE